MSTAQAVCPECGADLAPGRDLCWLCESRIQPLGQVNPYAPPAPPTEMPAGQFSLATLFLITTLVAVCLGAFLVAPGLGMLLAFVSVPALVRTMMATNRKRQAGIELTPAEKIGAFALSCVVIYAVGCAGLIAFFTVCLGTGLAALALGGNDNWIIGAAVGGGALVALPLTVWLLWISAPRAPLR